jgi:hypothetical protein
MASSSNVELRNLRGHFSTDATKEVSALSDITELNSRNLVAEDKDDAALMATKSTAADARGMQRMGKEQQLIRHFRLMSITSFVALATASWEIGLFLLTPALVDGGISGMCWSVIWNFLAYIPIYLSLAEMASMVWVADDGEVH